MTGILNVNNNVPGKEKGVEKIHCCIDETIRKK